MDTNVIYCGDNLEVLPKYILDESIDLVYIDPPFNSSRNYEVFWGEAQERRSFEDRFGDVMHYLEWMRPRLRELHRVLKPTGSFYYHCDWHASHYVKVELDRLFGFDNFRAEIIWRRINAKGLAFKGFPQNHDSLLYYSKSKDFIWNRPFKKHDPEYVKKFYRFIEPETGRKYMLADLTNPNHNRPNLTYEFLGINRVWRWTQDRMKAAYDAGIIVQTKPGTVPRLKRYFDEMEKQGQAVDTIWDEIEWIQSQSPESLGYPTQKPLALLERIINASSNEDDIVLDAFCGCGTTLEAAAKYKRKWIGIDSSPTACRVMAGRLEKRLGLKEGIDFILRDMPKTSEQLRQMPPFEFENWAVLALGGIPNKVKVGDYGIDGRLYLADIAKEHNPIIKITKGIDQSSMFETLDKWYPIQVKQRDKVGRPDIDKFETAMRRDKRIKGYFVAFGFSSDSDKEIRRANSEDGLEITPITVDELLRFEKTAS